MAEAKKDWLVAAVEALSGISPEQQEAAILELEKDHPGVGDRARALLEKLKEDELWIETGERAQPSLKNPKLQPIRVEPKVEVVKPTGRKIIRWVQGSNGSWSYFLEGETMPRRWFGPPPKEALELSKPKPEEPPPEEQEESKKAAVEPEANAVVGTDQPPLSGPGGMLV